MAWWWRAIGRTYAGACTCVDWREAYPSVNMNGKNRRKKVLDLKKVTEEMGLQDVLNPLIMDSCHIVLPKERRGERVRAFIHLSCVVCMCADIGC